MKERILNNWNAQRIIYVTLGGVVIAHSITVGEWPGIIFGAYFAAMGIFAFGCAAGYCGNNYKPHGKTRQKIADTEFEEIK